MSLRNARQWGMGVFVLPTYDWTKIILFVFIISNKNAFQWDTYRPPQ